MIFGFCCVSLGFSIARADEMQGITADQILVGTTQTLSGLGAAVKGSVDAQAGIEAYFKRVNDAGGIYGRKIKLLVRDHGYDMPKAIQLTKELVEQDKIFALIAPVSTSVMVATRPYVNRVGIPEVGPIDGDPNTRVPVNPTIFHVRPSFEYECQAVLRYIRDHLHLKEAALFRPNSALGEALRLTYLKVAHDEGMTITAVGSEGAVPGDLDEALKTIMAVHPKAVLLTGPAPANNRFLKKMIAAGVQADYFVNSPSMDTEVFQGLTGGPSFVIASSGFPVEDESYEIVKEYNEDVKKIRKGVGPMAFETYAGAAVFVEGLKKAGPKLTRHKFLEAMDSLKTISVGGLPLTITPEQHAGITRAWLLKVTKDSVTSFNPDSAKNEEPVDSPKKL